MIPEKCPLCKHTKHASYLNLIPCLLLRVWYNQRAATDQSPLAVDPRSAALTMAVRWSRTSLERWVRVCVCPLTSTDPLPRVQPVYRWSRTSLEH